MISEIMPTEETIKQTKNWLDRAKRDFEKARDDLERGWLPESCFHSQQASEKALKAFLRSRGVVVKGHRIEKLLDICRGRGLEVGPFLRDIELVSDLSDQYGAPRYPNFMGRREWRLEDYTEGFATSCLKLAEGILRKVEECIRESLT